MVRAWRIVRAARAADAFTGEGARQFGGRWNSPGTAVVYCSEHQSLAALEILVHLQPRGSLRFVAFPLEIPDAIITRTEAAVLPPHWRVEPPGAGTMQVGDEWAKGARSAVLAVPSTIIPEETNYLLNPLHPDYPRIALRPAQPFSFDPRLLV